MSRKRKTRSADNAVKPPTIDLEATEVTQGEEPVAETSASATDEAAPEAPPASEAAESTEVDGETEDKQAKVEAPDEAASTEPVPLARARGGGVRPRSPSRPPRSQAAVAGLRQQSLQWLPPGRSLLYREYGAQLFPSSETAAAIEKLDARMAALEKAQSASPAT